MWDTCPVPSAASNVDSDLDGLPDELEFIAGTDATDPADSLKLESNGLVNGNVSLQFVARVGRTYTIERKSTLSSTEGWTVWKDDLLGTGGLLTVSDLPVGETAYYRLRVKPASSGYPHGSHWLSGSLWGRLTGFDASETTVMLNLPVALRSGGNGASGQSRLIAASSLRSWRRFHSWK